MVTLADLVPSADGFLHEPGLWYSRRLPALCPSQGILGPLPILTSGVLPTTASGTDVLAINAAAAAAAAASLPSLQGAETAFSVL